MDVFKHQGSNIPLVTRQKGEPKQVQYDQCGNFQIYPFGALKWPLETHTHTQANKTD